MLGKSLKFALIAFINVVACLFAVAAYFTYAKLTYPAFFCGSFGTIDAQIGWVIAPNATSCMGGREPFGDGAPWYEAKVFSDVNGFRSAEPGTPTARGGVLAVGDSFTFGYGVDFAGSYPGQLQKLAEVPVMVAASPAYGAAQAIMLAERWLEPLSPRAIVYLDLGFWERSACRGSYRPRMILKPCYWQAPGAQSGELVVPPAGRVAKFASWGVLPGGMLGAGEDSWSYFLLSRPVALTLHLLTRANMLAGFGHDFHAVGVDAAAIQRGVLEHLARVGAKARVPVLLLDPNDIYARDFGALAPERRTNLHRIGTEVWRREVGEPAAKLPPEQAKVPHDGHYGPGTNALIAALIRERLRALGVAL